MKPLLEGAIELPLDKYRIRIDELNEENQSLKQKNDSLEQKNSDLLALLKQYQKQENAPK
ncbi:MAG: hypothetical protein PHE02_13270 [Lachnospiraceae bacterium]|nr:hypothetical protein [Lachnospiraceae bacterium]